MQSAAFVILVEEVMTAMQHKDQHQTLHYLDFVLVSDRSIPNRYYRNHKATISLYITRNLFYFLKKSPNFDDIVPDCYC